MVYYAFWFYVLLIPLAVVLAVTYSTAKKLFPLIYVLSIFTYINWVLYTIDAFNLGKNGILFILGFSSVILIGMGLMIGKNLRKIPNRA